MKLEQSLVNLSHGENSNSSVEDTGLGGGFYFSIFILNYLYFKPKFLERFTEVNGLIGLTEVR